VNDGIVGALDAARVAWPDVTVDRARFAAHVRKLPADALERFGADLVLAFACTEGDAAALACFEREMLGPARAAIRSLDGSAAFVDEACQRLRTSLLVGEDGPPKIATYAGHGPLRAWVAMAAARVGLMMIRATKRKREVSDDDWPEAIAMIAIGNPELDLLKRQYAVAFSQALREAATKLEPRQRSALRMHFHDALTLDEIGAVYAVHRATAARWIAQAREVLFDETRRLLAARLQLSEVELDRITALVGSQLDVSLSQLLPLDR
jgi:RNA polymerase sigma-70 factor (ECF subfamily)